MGFLTKTYVNFLLAIVAVLIGGAMRTEELPPYLKHVDTLIHEFEKEMVKEFDLVGVGSGGRMPKDVEEIRVIFYAYRRATLEEARSLEVALTEKLIKKINDSEQLRPYLREHPFTSNRAKISISFCKKDNSRYTDGSVSNVFNARNKLFYSAIDPKTDTQIDLHEEPYEDALKLVKK